MTGCAECNYTGIVPAEPWSGVEAAKNPNYRRRAKACDCQWRKTAK